MRRTILLADDSPTIHRLVTNTFADADFEIVSVSNGEAAVRKFEEIHPHVVLADIYMPGKTGYEVCTYVRQHPTVGNTPVILLVGAFDVFDEDRAHEIGANGHITKPFEPRALFSLVESVLPSEEVAPDETAKADFANKTVIIPPVRQPEPHVVESPPEPPAEPPVEVAAEVAPEPQYQYTPPAAEPIPIAVPEPSPEPPAMRVREEDDLLGLESLFPEPVQETGKTTSVTEVDIDRIADRVMKRISSEVIESIVWELVPDIAEKIVREELKRKQ